MSEPKGENDERQISLESNSAYQPYEEADKKEREKTYEPARITPNRKALIVGIIAFIICILFFTVGVILLVTNREASGFILIAVGLGCVILSFILLSFLTKTRRN
eukprot:TRINITY_DN3317_c0_g1_i2.p1 TRINITY_DN3317_c0_g1~~TRINITY_DN3317_c0_g1_i2.p1  ORF type:complete len:113 (-),score=17.57 TRINITY_DN3317_c0_g1_i2:13-327(-)